MFNDQSGGRMSRGSRVGTAAGGGERAWAVCHGRVGIPEGFDHQVAPRRSFSCCEAGAENRKLAGAVAVTAVAALPRRGVSVDAGDGRVVAASQMTSVQVAHMP
jgi:hypothetical protein